ncbi:uncharacterized protein LOC128327186 [Hemicordylus capensis]|uniref:uncharacterized protein LOC128327186 n=1 Tax=Hemicordylus capensis TaxID=884348 RepID=UPI002302308B|nr:uncharacterized protein LOC128327186 [Hemicordylus capensis]
MTPSVHRSFKSSDTREAMDTLTDAGDFGLDEDKGTLNHRLGEVIEQVVASQLQPVQDDADYLVPFQNSFWVGYGVKTALVDKMDDLQLAIDRESVTLLILLNLSMAFDTIEWYPSGLPEAGGIGWHCFTLSGRSQMVLLGDCCSAKQVLKCGVQQVSTLSPMLFNIYMKPLGRIIRRFDAGCYQYSDDSQIYFSMSISSGNGISSLNACLEVVMGWMRDNKLKLNPNKPEVLTVWGRDLRDGLDLPVLHRVTLPLKDQVCSLAVLLDPKLSLVSHVEAMIRSAFYQLWLICQLPPFLEVNDLKTGVQVLVISRLDYWNAHYMGLPLYIVRKLQLVQNVAARLVSGITKGTHNTVFKGTALAADMFPGEIQSVGCYLNGLGPGYLREHLCHNPCHLLRSSGEVWLQLPLAHLVATWAQAFSVAVLGLWNMLPAEIRASPSLFVFRKNLKTHLFSQAFN